MRSSTERSFYNLYWASHLVLVVVSPLLGLCATLSIVSCMIFVRLLIERHVWPRYIDFVLVPLRPDQLPRNTYVQFNRWTPEFMALGCGLVGDFRLAYKPRTAFVRYFLPSDRRVKGEVLDWDEQFVPGFTTIFDDGRLLETARLPAHHSQSAEDSRLWFHGAPEASIAELYALHQRKIDIYESTYSAKALTVTPDRLLDFAQYGHRLVWWERNELPERYGSPQVPVGERQMTNDTRYEALSRNAITRGSASPGAKEDPATSGAPPRQSLG